MFHDISPQSISRTRMARRCVACPLPIGVCHVCARDSVPLPLHLQLQLCGQAVRLSPPPHTALSPQTVPVEINSAKQRMVLLADYLSFRDPGLSAMYLRNLHMCRWFPDEVAALIVPPCMGIDLLTDPKQTPGLPDEWRHWFELFVSTPSCPGFPVLHVDVCSIHAFSMQLHGVKRFTFFPPGDSPRLYPLPPANTASGLPTNLDAVDLDEFPAFSGARPTSVDLQPGEVLYMPAGWWHTARAVGDSPSVTIAGSFVGEDNIDRFLDDYGDFSAVRSLVARGAAILK